LCPIIKNNFFINLYTHIRPLPAILFFYLLGVILGKSISISFSTLTYLYFLIITLLLFSIIGYIGRLPIVTTLLFIIILMIGFLNYHLQSQPFGSNNIVKFTDYSNLKIIGTVLEKEEYSGQDKYSISLKVKEIEKDGLKLSVSGLTLVNIYLKNCPYQYGDILSIQGKIIQPSSQENFGDFNYRFFLAQKRIFTQINIWQEQYITKIGTEKMNQFIAFSKRIRDRLKNIINILIGPPYNNLLIGILLGERNDLSSEIKDIFLESGIMHILAVSGLHVGIIIAALYFILKLVPLSPPLKAIIIIISLIFYSSLLGFRSSVLRATTVINPSK